MFETKHQQGFILPTDLHNTISHIGLDVMKKHFPLPIVKQTEQLHLLSEQSIQSPSTISAIQSTLDGLSHTDFQQLIKAVYVFSFLNNLEKKSGFQSRFDSQTPLTDSLSYILKKYSISEAATLIPKLIVSAYTPHPVNPDPSDLGMTKRELMLAYSEWKRELKSFDTTTPDERSSKSEHIDVLSREIKRCITMLCTSQHLPKVKVTPAEEQSKINRLISDNEKALVAGKKRMNRLIHLAFLSQIAETLLKTNLSQEEKDSLRVILDSPKNQDKLNALIVNPLIANHPDFGLVMTLSIDIRTHIWRQDGDGHDKVTARSAGEAVADGRLRVFSGITSDTAILRFDDNSLSITLLNKMEESLKSVMHIPYWQNYIDKKIELGWGIAKIYSGLVFHRMQEALRGAEEFLTTPSTAPFSLLRAGFRHDREFRSVIALLAQAEKEMDSPGFWTEQVELSHVRGIDLGDTHIRKGEKFHNQLLSDVFSVVYPTHCSSKKPFESLPVATQKNILREAINDQSFPNLPLDINLHLSGPNKLLFDSYRSAMQISPWSMLIQSDSGGETNGDIELSTLILIATSKLIEHRGQLAVLCETKDSMEQAISVINSQQFPKDRVIWMCAGSDNQKRMGPLLSAYLNWKFLNAAQENGYNGFFGVGCSGFRSSYHDPLGATFRTVQPGQQNRILDPRHMVRSMLEDVATKIQTAEEELANSPEEKKQKAFILETIAYAVYAARTEGIPQLQDLRELIEKRSGQSSLYFSRPGKKPGGDVLDTMRAIELARTQVVLNTIDPQLIGILDGVKAGIKSLNEAGVSNVAIQEIYQTSAQGRASLKTLEEFHNFLDPALRNPTLCNVGRETIAEAYFLLSGLTIPNQSIDPGLRLMRIMRTKEEGNQLHDLLIGSATAV